MKIPLPPLPVQQAIVAACEAVDEEYNRTRMSIEDYRAKIERLFSEIGIIYKKKEDTT
jgi:restriction endonuclease S subunit